ncbi:MAG: hypothetical protein FJ100_00785 [Deltaproteobacteria bacterium]|nr:hypothetical protein [Deltaproteobacteria bacterium]
MHTVDVALPIVRGGPAPETHPDLRAAVAQASGVPLGDLGVCAVRRRAMDLRKRHRPLWILRIDAFLASETPPDDALPPLLRPHRLAHDVSGCRPVVVGMGPAGLFAALAFADAGIRCTIVDRGEAVEPRSLKVRDLRVHGQLDPESNLCFGEGGAGTYSDGKLYTRSKHPWVRLVYERLVALGADRDILVAAHPHIGTNYLIRMLRVLRAALVEAGHDLRFGRRVDDLITAADGPGQRVVGVRLDDGTELQATAVVWATGHSARDTYQMLARRGVALQRKDFAIGARVEHPQALVDGIQLGGLAGDATVGASEYFLRQTAPSGRGAYSFCMCPGGLVLPTPTRAERLNVNGMSNANRGSGFANAAWVAQVAAGEFYWDQPGDLDRDPEFGAHVAGGALVGLALQDRLEAACFAQGGGGYVAPAQRLTDFVAGRPSADLPPRSTFRPALAAGRIDRLLPSRIVADLQAAARQVDRAQMRGWLSAEAAIVGVETTTSSPVRILRNADRQSVSHPGLYPCAEGAGYAGGIVSSAIDGLEAARALIGRCAPLPAA